MPTKTPAFIYSTPKGHRIRIPRQAPCPHPVLCTCTPKGNCYKTWSDFDDWTDLIEFLESPDAPTQPSTIRGLALARKFSQDNVTHAAQFTYLDSDMERESIISGS